MVYLEGDFAGQNGHIQGIRQLLLQEKERPSEKKGEEKENKPRQKQATQNKPVYKNQIFSQFHAVFSLFPALQLFFSSHVDVYFSLFVPSLSQSC